MMRHRWIGLSLLSFAGGCAAMAPVDWRTQAERTAFAETGRYDEIVAFGRNLQRASAWVRVVSIGVTGEGREMPLYILSRERAFTPAAARATGKTVVLLTNGIHAGEIEGKDASLALVRDIAVTRREESLLDHVILLVLPIFNIDGHERFGPYNRINQNGPREMGWRCTADCINLNRDFLKADAVEMRAWLRMFHAWRPHLFFDNHTTDGADFRYDVTFGLGDGPYADPGISTWLNGRLAPHLLDTLTRDGHVPQFYFDMRNRLDPGQGIDSGGFTPRFSTGYGAIANSAAILVETHMLKPYDVRVKATYDIMRRTLQALNARPNDLRDAVAAADQTLVTRQNAPLPLAVATTQPAGAGDPIVFHGYAHDMRTSAASGAKYPVWDRTRPVDTPTHLFRREVADKSVDLPDEYIIPPQWAQVIDRLQLHGLEIRRISEPVTLDVDSYRLTDVKWAEQPFEGRHLLTYAAVPIRERREFPAGSVRVATRQPLARIAFHLLEPDAPDALIRWGFFDAVFEQKEYFEDYSMAPIADRMLGADPALRAEFERWQATSPTRARNPRARLHFFYERSPYQDSRKAVYPVGRIVQGRDPES